MYCEYCGSQIDDHSKFCIHCGTRIENNTTEVQGNDTATTNYNYAQTPQFFQNEHLTTGGWVGRLLLCNIPIVGFVLLLIWAFGEIPQKSLKTWARAQLIFELIAVGIIVITVVIIVSVVASNVSTTSYRFGSRGYSYRYY